MSKNANGAGRRLPHLLGRFLAPAALLFALVSAAGAAPPNVSVSITSPTNGQTLSGSVTWQVAASSDTSRVDFAVDGTVKSTDTSAPFSYSLDTTALSNGSHTLSVTGTGKGNRTSSASVSVTVSNAAPPPPPTSSLAISTSSPANGATVSGKITWQANVTSGTATKVDFYIDGAKSWTEWLAPYVYDGDGATLDTTTLTDGSHTLAVTATAADGTTSSSSVTVTVANSTGALPVAGAPTATALPAISGTAQVGQTLKASTGTWTGSPTAYAYQWQRCDATGASCSAISGAASASYVTVTADQGHALRATVTASNTTGSATAVSAPTAAVQATAQPAAALGSSLPSRLPMSSGAGGTFYVDGTNGSDSNSGSASAPWKTINKALATVPLAGSIIKVLPGTYASSGTNYVLAFGRQASTSDPITLEAQTPGTVMIVNGTPDSWTLGGWIHDASGLRIQGIVFRVHGTANLNKGADELLIENSDRIEIFDCTFNEAGTGGPAVRGGTSNGQTSDDVWFIDNTFRPSGSDPFAQVTGTGWSSDQYFGSKGSHWIYAGQYGDASNFEVTNGARRLVIVNNVFTGSTAGRDVQLGPQTQSSFVVDNTFYGNHAASVIGKTTQAVYAGGGVEFFTDSNTSSYQTGGNVVANNLFVDLDGHGAYGSGPTESGNVVRSNLSYGLRNGSGYQGRTSMDYEPLYGTSTLFQVGTNLGDGDPLFANPSSYDFHLKIGSPAFGKGDPAYAYPYDADGAARPATPAVGAFG
jgi:hypothetical protein